MGCRPPGSSVHGILPARTLESVAIPFSRGSSRPRTEASPALQADPSPAEPPEKLLPASHGGVSVVCHNGRAQILCGCAVNAHESVTLRHKNYTCTRAKLLQSCPILCDSTDCSAPGSSAHGILQTRRLGWVVMLSSRGSSRPRDRTHISNGSCTAGRFFTAETWGKPKNYTWYKPNLI